MRRGESARAFVAVELPGDVKAALEPTLTALRTASIPALRPVRSEATHLTLRFLGSVQAERLEPISEALESAVRRLRPFQLVLGSPGSFPPSRQPSVLWVGLDGEVDGARRLRDTVTEALSPLGFQPERTPFRPHITVARLGRNATGPDRRKALGLSLANPPPPVEFEVGSVSLMQSHLGLAGASYGRLWTARLAGDA